MNNIFVFISLLMIGNALFAQQHTFHIKGKIDDIEDTKIYLVDVGAFYKLKDVSRVVDSCIIKDGFFEFRGLYSQPHLYALSIPDLTNQYRLLIVEPGEILVEGSLESFFKSKVTAGKENILYQQANEENNHYTVQRNLLVDSIYKYGNDLKERNFFKHKYDSIGKLKKDADLRFVRSHPTSFVSLMIVDRMVQDKKSVAILEENYNMLAPDLKMSLGGKLVANRITSLKNLKKGRQMPRFEAVDIYGEKITSEQYRGKLLIIDFWATWCIPCLEKIPDLRGIFERNQEYINIVSISLDKDLENCRTTIEKLGMEWDNICDTQSGRSPIALDYNVNAIPRLLICNDEGIVIYDSETDEEDITDFIAKEIRHTY